MTASGGSAAQELETSRENSPAEVYERCFVPALFDPWARVLSELADLRPGQQVLDVATGTGVLACRAADRVQPGGLVTGLDASEEMLSVARRKRADVRWEAARAERLPYPDARFDRVISQFGLMFFEDRAAGLREMLRVLRPGGRMAVAVCGAIDHSPGYAVLTELLHRLFGPAVAAAFRAPFALGDPEELRALSAAAGIAGARVARYEGTARFPSIASLVATERACAWTLGGILGDADFARLLGAAQESLAPFVKGGEVAIDLPALVLTATRA